MRSDDPATAKQKRVWGRSAPGYDDMMSGLERHLLAGTREWVGRRAAGEVLEVAVGTGRSLPFYDAGVTVTGVDLSPDMLELARRRAHELDRSVDLLEADAERLPFEDERFDTVVCVLALCSIPRPPVAIREMIRVLKPGGALLLVDHVGSTWPPVYLGQWLVERVTIPTHGEHLTRRSFPIVERSGLRIQEHERLKAGIVERISAVRSP